MNRGVESTNSVVLYLFLSLFPTLDESIVVLVIFAAHFQLASLSFIVLMSLVLSSNKHDNECHDKATDALINYETIRYFTNEKYEVYSHTDVIRKFQTQCVTAQVSLSLLNPSQALVFQMTIFGSLAIAAPYLSELLSIEPDVMDHPHAVDLSVREHRRTHGIPVSFRNVSFQYPRSTGIEIAGEDLAIGSGVRDLTFSFPAGTTTALVEE
ncbi:unnamed protein product [Albugo candida]|uniref:ABC transmembrane type-1 domain-containing protein n=1 Tax=Albugo candida TaxID=65357 RepID=A0A024G1P5_9STRA|nr:unnamed protein product [Albugo candida]|eukprot:CCI40456.1 unnamed protein product [Albugo candida]